MKQRGDQHPEQDADDPVAQLGQINERAEPVQEGERKGKGYLDPGIGDALRSGGQPGAEGHHRQRHRQQADDGFGMRLNKDDTRQRQGGGQQRAGHPQEGLLHGGPQPRLGDNHAAEHDGVDPLPVGGGIEQVADQGGQ